MEEKDLERYARRHIAYEVRTMVLQVDAWFQVRGEPTVVRDALIEAPLVHFRLIDDFLGKKAKDNNPRTCKTCGRVSRDVLAVDYLDPDAIPPGAFLDDQERHRMNWQVAHLSDQREDVVWDLPDLRRRACSAFMQFVEALPIERRHWFVGAEYFAMQWSC